MSDATHPTLDRLFDAYALLEVGYDARPDAIARAHRLLRDYNQAIAREADSGPRERAALKVQALDAAYALIREAPLNGHDIGKGSGWEGTLDVEAVLAERRRQGHRARRSESALTVGFVIVSAFIFSVLISLGTAGIVTPTPRSLLFSTIGTALFWWFGLRFIIFRYLFNALWSVLRTALRVLQALP